MLIGRIEHDPKKQLPLQLPESTLGRLELYKELYQQTFGEKVANSDLVDLMLTTLMDRDRAFRRYEKEVERRKKQEAKQQEKLAGETPSAEQAATGSHAEAPSHQREPHQA
ncbi:DUF2274 domain-containing protein [Modicisalibacter xianhensis]|uniref:DUF2274 domain-containing protein n=1 Tax=Modicisalibacter xianhensis TaxID=442341 RepID=A0A1I3EL01_9GAMM|nr:DUF2274 domain-containing protein [Halomonas xianhensis]SFH99675.1 hypothetical protein SAMN04487959_11431 [Halomonas xianhensis]